MDTLTKGDFGAAKAEIIEKTGIQNYNVQMDSMFGKFPGVVNEDGTQIDFWGELTLKKGCVIFTNKGHSQ